MALTEMRRISHPEDPERCQGITAIGQCQCKRVPGTKYCPIHGGTGIKARQEKRQMYNLKLKCWQKEAGELLDSAHVKNLRDEIAILRLMLQEQLNQCQDSHDLVLRSGPVADLILKIEKLVQSCHRLEVQTNQVLDRQSLMNLTDRLVHLLPEYVAPDRLDALAAAIVQLFADPDAVRPTERQQQPVPAQADLSVLDDHDGQ